MSEAPAKCILKPGEQCLYCGHVGPKKEPKARLTCPGCSKEFTKGQAWRLYFRKRWHVACVEEVQARAATGNTTTVAEQPTSPAPILPVIPEFTCENCTWDGADQTLKLARRCKRCAGKLGFSLRVKKKQQTNETNP